MYIYIVNVQSHQLCLTKKFHQLDPHRLGIFLQQFYNRILNVGKKEKSTLQCFKKCE